MSLFFSFIFLQSGRAFVTLIKMSPPSRTFYSFSLSATSYFQRKYPQNPPFLLLLLSIATILRRQNKRITIICAFCLFICCCHSVEYPLSEGYLNHKTAGSYHASLLFGKCSSSVSPSPQINRENCAMVSTNVIVLQGYTTTTTKVK